VRDFKLENKYILLRASKLLNFLRMKIYSWMQI